MVMTMRAHTVVVGGIAEDDEGQTPVIIPEYVDKPVHKFRYKFIHMLISSFLKSFSLSTAESHLAPNCLAQQKSLSPAWERSFLNVLPIEAAHKHRIYHPN
jgi:hypothetical protein